MKTEERYIPITSCRGCHYWRTEKCKPSQELSASQRIFIMTGVGLKNPILRDCPLPTIQELINKSKEP